MSSRRWLYTIAAVLAWAGTGLRIGRNILDPQVTHGPTGGLFGPYQGGATGSLQRIGDDLSYFTHWSNIAIALVWTMLARNPDRDTPLFRAGRNTGLLMITLTGVLYAVLIAPTDHVDGWFNLLVNTLVHYVNPVVALVVWALCGPHGWFTWRRVWQLYVVPTIFLLFTLARGAVTHTYPYKFFNVTHLGYQTVLITMVVIVAASTVFVAGFITVEQRLVRRRPRA